MGVTRGQMLVSHSRRGIPTYQIEIAHTGLHKHRVIRGNDQNVVARKADLQIQQWEQSWFVRSSKDALQRSREQGKQAAAELTEEAESAQRELEAVLAKTLSVDDRIDWDTLKDHSSFGVAKPIRPAPTQKSPLPEPAITVPATSLLDRIIPGRVASKQDAADSENARRHKEWQSANARIAEDNKARMAEVDAAHAVAMAKWEAERAEFVAAQAARNAAIDEAKGQYLAAVPDAITGYCDLVLSRSEYIDCFPKEWDLDYNSETKTLVVDYSMPAPDAIPRTVEVRYVQSKNELAEKLLSDSQVAKLYDDVLYQLALRTIHELFEADAIDAIVAIGFNGYVRSVDRATGNEVNACVMSLHVSKDQFTKINLAQVDPKVCFKQLRGVGSSRLHSVTAVAPVISIRREDGRFVSAREIATQLDDGYNLAGMDWEDFEHLIREVFAKEFASGGGEVKVTRASRDGGVDAVAFDPDPIRGGKIVIQAKRYTGTVSVAAVRDLYGTVVNEGATKGILVTTSDYGPDAYEFAQGKPLTLMNGANLLHLLEKHGHRARINLAEARAEALGKGSFERT